jgi:hypothetical protein
MSIKGQPKCMHGMIARDELLDTMDCLNLKISQCKEAGMTNEEIQKMISEYHECHCDYPIVTLSD